MPIEQQTIIFIVVCVIVSIAIIALILGLSLGLKHKKNNTQNVMNAGSNIDKNIWINEHNRVRRDVGQPPVFWNQDMANASTAYAEQCKGMNHSPQDQRIYNNILLGENLIEATPAVYTPANGKPTFIYPTDRDYVVAWENEKQYYHHPQYPNHDNGHYVQMINKNVKEIGCGCSMCNNKKLCVCRYNPSQIENQYPY